MQGGRRCRSSGRRRKTGSTAARSRVRLDADLAISRPPRGHSDQPAGGPDHGAAWHRDLRRQRRLPGQGRGRPAFRHRTERQARWLGAPGGDFWRYRNPAHHRGLRAGRRRLRRDLSIAVLAAITRRESLGDRFWSNIRLAEIASRSRQPDKAALSTSKRSMVKAQHALFAKWLEARLDRCPLRLQERRQR